METVLQRDVTGDGADRTRVWRPERFRRLQPSRPVPAPSLLSFPVRRDADGALRFRLPRQGVGSRLRLTARETDGQPWELPLGEWMDKAGYDWSLPSLEDFSLEIDYAASEVRIRVLDWESGDALTLKI